MAVEERNRWLRAQGYVNQSETPQPLQILGRDMVHLTEDQIKWAPHEKDRYEKPYDLKPIRKKRKLPRLRIATRE